MKTKLILVLFLIINYSFAQNKTFKDNQFNWTMSVPEGCTIIKSKTWLKEKNKENTAKGYEIENEDNSKIIVVMSFDSLNYFVAYRDFDLKKSSAFINLKKNMKEIHSKGQKITGNNSNEKVKIANLEFNKVKFDYNFPDKSYICTEVYGAFINQKVFTVYVQYSDKQKGAQLIENLEKSTFQ